MKIEIKKWTDNEIILSGEYESIKDCLERNRSADLRSADLRSADLRSADLSYADLSSTDLRSADLSYADLRSANLSAANLRSANLSYADLRYANLRSADLSSADLSYADLSSANLSYADLRYADYKGFKIKETPIQINNLQYPILVFTNHIEIGCELHKTKEWADFTNKQIISMNGQAALKFWKRYKTILLELSRQHRLSK